MRRVNLQAARSGIPPIAALAVGALLWFVPTLGQPLVGPIVAALRALGLPQEDTGGYPAGFVATLVLRWFAVVLLLVFVLAVEGQPLSSLGVRAPRAKDLLLTVAVAVLATVIGFGLYLLIQGGEVDGATQTGRILTSLSFGQLVHLVVNAAVVEELFFRGFLIERTIAVTGRPWLAAVGSYLLFVGSHIPGSGLPTALTITAVGSLALVGLYMLRRNLFLCVGAHALGDTPILLAG
ncbi:MAG: CPBP family intramembrane metalloprotease [Streptosporangiales bacterium]|nr:CPBP family intramembrane metalloprotease [Streptosporangiales bacterium]